MASGWGRVRAGRCRGTPPWSTEWPASCLTTAGAAVYAVREGLVEPVIRQIKLARGFRQISLRGFENVQGEWALVCAHIIPRLYRRACEATGKAHIRRRS